mmetsp:Transcript_28690/g.71451  ORF Transcript_28690/g.71451 Transcript_28690/m.71451 type:complete len:230 (+) Transcript_28690:1110-1799(+)
MRSSTTAGSPHCSTKCSRPCCPPRPGSKRTKRAVVSMLGPSERVVSAVSSSKSRSRVSPRYAPRRSANGLASSARMSRRVVSLLGVPGGACSSRCSAYPSSSRRYRLATPSGHIALETAASSISAVCSSSSGASSGATALKHMKRAYSYDSGCTRSPSRPGGCRSSPARVGGTILMKPAALVHTQGPSSSFSPSRSTMSLLLAAFCCSSRSSAAALRGPRPGRNCTTCE